MLYQTSQTGSKFTGILTKILNFLKFVDDKIPKINTEVK